MDILLDDYETNYIVNGGRCFTAPFKEINENICLINNETGKLIKKVSFKNIEQYKLDKIENLTLPILVFDGMEYEEYTKIIELKKECAKQKFISSYNGGFTVWNKTHILCWIIK